MPEDVQEFPPGAPQSPEAAAPPSFAEFLRRKGEEFHVRERHGRRSEWLGAINRLYDQIREWLREADPEGLLDIVPYQVSRTEPILGTYDAPALQILLGPAEAQVVPMGREVRRYNLRGPSDAATDVAGRVDITDGLRTYNLFREKRRAGDRWQVCDERNRFTDLNRQEFERILEELLS
jgi:hypothetical protein